MGLYCKNSSDLNFKSVIAIQLLVGWLRHSIVAFSRNEAVENDEVEA
jgi:hypothetical protein